MNLQTIQKISRRLPEGSESWINFGLSHLSSFWSVNRIKARVDQIQSESPSVKSFYLKPNSLWKGFLPGQHVEFRIPINGRIEVRSFSFSSHPSDDHLRFTIKRIPGGRITNYLHDITRVGDLIEISDPYGDFVVHKGIQKNLYIAGGSGITPILSHLRELEISGSKNETILLYFCRNSSEILFEEELRNIQIPGFQFRIFLSEEENTRYGSGLFSNKILNHYGIELNQFSIFLCGPAGLKDSVNKALKEGAFNGNLYTEDFYFNRDTDILNEEKNVKLLFRTREEKVGNGTVLQSLLDKGIAVPFGCKAGICNTCSCIKSKGRVKDLRTGMISSDNKERIKLCTSIAMSDLELEI